VAFTYSSSVESALTLESELNALELKPKDISRTQQTLMKRRQWLMLSTEFGTVDILNKQCRITKDNLLMRMSEEDFDKVIDVNLSRFSI
jgi:3-oxoacyl-[acyl-carrier protein] reductase